MRRILAFRNKGGMEFENATDDWDLGKQGISSSAAFADLDRDGDMDLIVNNYNEPGLPLSQSKWTQPQRSPKTSGQ